MPLVVPFVLLMMSLVAFNYAKMSDCFTIFPESCLFIYWVPYAISGERFLNLKKFTISLLILCLKNVFSFRFLLHFIAFAVTFSSYNTPLTFCGFYSMNQS